MRRSHNGIMWMAHFVSENRYVSTALMKARWAFSHIQAVSTQLAAPPKSSRVLSRRMYNVWSAIRVRAILSQAEQKRKLRVGRQRGHLTKKNTVAGFAGKPTTDPCGPSVELKGMSAI